MLLLSMFLLARIDDGRKSMASRTSSNKMDKTSQIDRSSRFIQFVLVVFLVTESPQGVFNIFGGLCVIDYIKVPTPLRFIRRPSIAFRWDPVKILLKL
uniref:Uncharacterized protein n=1 Tax=Caenorhabditis japonica TaxID=281687 RepID=A0A8R1IIF2_CAEJA